MPPEGVDGAKQPQQPTPYSVIFKSGDDLRQDQLVLQMPRTIVHVALVLML